MNDERIESLAALEASIGKKPATMDLKVIDHLDPGALAWLSATSLAFIGFASDSGPVPTIAGGKAGFIKADRDTLEFPVSALDSADQAIEGAGFGSLMILPQLGEMLRVNGVVARRGEHSFLVQVAECYIHCAKALIRSEFWRPEASLTVDGDPLDGVSNTRFLALVTMSEIGEVDVSPKGDPAGLLCQAAAGQIWLAERPGNRRADSFKNILSQPRTAGIFLQPGASEVQVFHGKAQPTTDGIRAQLAVNGRVPAVATQIDLSNLVQMESAALRRSEIWSRPGSQLKPASLLTEHLKLNRRSGVSARLVGAVSSLPGVIQGALNSDYKKNLY